MREIYDELKFIIKYIDPFNTVFCFVSYFILVGTVFQLSSAFLQQTIINVIDESSLETFIKTIVFSSILILSAILLTFCGGIIRDYYVKRLENKLLEKLLIDIGEKNYLKIEMYHSSDLMTRIASNSHSFISAFQTAVFQLASNLLLFIGAFWYLSSIQFMLAVLILASGIISLIIGRFFDPRLKNLTKEINDDNVCIRSNSKEVLQNIDIIKTYECNDYIIQKNRNLRDSQLKHLNRRAIYSSSLWNSLLAVNDGFMIIVAFVLCVISIQSDAYVGSLLAFINLIGRVQWPFIDMSNLIAVLHQNITTAKRTIEILEIDCNNKRTIENEKEYAVECRELSYFYGEKKVLDNISIKIEHGKRIGIAGKSGSGKSTFAKLVGGLYEVQKGYIIGGEVIYIAQFPHLFNATVFENVRIGDVSASDNQINEIIEKALLNDLVDTFEQGLSNIIKEGASNLSGGEKQRIAIARAALCKAKIIIMDEITSSLDLTSEKRIIEQIDNLFIDKTVIYITHRKSILQRMDEILLFDNGVLVTQGSHADLLQNNTLYSLLINENAGE